MSLHNILNRRNTNEHRSKILQPQTRTCGLLLAERPGSRICLRVQDPVCAYLKGQRLPHGTVCVQHPRGRSHLVIHIVAQQREEGTVTLFVHLRVPQAQTLDEFDEVVGSQDSGWKRDYCLKLCFFEEH